MIANWHDELLSAYLDGELTPTERADVERKLAGDGALRRRLEGLRAVQQAVQSLPKFKLEDDFHEQVIARARQVRDERTSIVLFPAERTGKEPAEPIRRWHAPFWVGIAATALICATILVGKFAPRETHVAMTAPAETSAVDDAADEGAQLELAQAGGAKSAAPGASGAATAYSDGDRTAAQAPGSGFGGLGGGGFGLSPEPARMPAPTAPETSARQNRPLPAPGGGPLPPAGPAAGGDDGLSRARFKGGAPALDDENEALVKEAERLFFRQQAAGDVVICDVQNVADYVLFERNLVDNGIVLHDEAAETAERTQRETNPPASDQAEAYRVYVVDTDPRQLDKVLLAMQAGNAQVSRTPWHSASGQAGAELEERLVEMQQAEGLLQKALRAEEARPGEVEKEAGSQPETERGKPRGERPATASKPAEPAGATAPALSDKTAKNGADRFDAEGSNKKADRADRPAATRGWARVLELPAEEEDLRAAIADRQRKSELRSGVDVRGGAEMKAGSKVPAKGAPGGFGGGGPAPRPAPPGGGSPEGGKLAADRRGKEDKSQPPNALAGKRESGAPSASAGAAPPGQSAPARAPVGQSQRGAKGPDGKEGDKLADGEAQIAQGRAADYAYAAPQRQRSIVILRLKPVAPAANAPQR
jgi:hypothetical protein